MSLGASCEAGALRADGPPPVYNSYKPLPEQPGIGASPLTRARRNNPNEHSPNSTTNSPNSTNLCRLPSHGSMYASEPSIPRRPTDAQSGPRFAVQL